MGLKENCLQCSVADAHGKAATNHFGLNKMLINIQSVCHHTCVSGWACWYYEITDTERLKISISRRMALTRLCTKSLSKYPKRRGLPFCSQQSLQIIWDSFAKWGKMGQCCKREEALPFYLYMFYLWRYIYFGSMLLINWKLELMATDTSLVLKKVDALLWYTQNRGFWSRQSKGPMPRTTICNNFWENANSNFS